MAREKISLVPDELKEQKQIESMIQSGEINKNNFDKLNSKEQKEVSRVLFQIAANKLKLEQGISAVEFILFSFMRITNKKVSGLPLSAEDKVIEEKLNRILEMHEITNQSMSIKDWLVDYLDYAYDTSEYVLQNRKDHIQRKKHITGKY